MRVQPMSLASSPWYLRPLFWLQRRHHGAVLDSSRLWARSPALFVRLALFYGGIDRKGSPIPPALRSLVTVRVSQINHCSFCVDLNSATLIKRGVAADKVAALADWRTSTLFDERERAALDYAEAMTRPEPGVDDAQVACLRRFWDDDAIVELTALVAFQNLSSKFNAALAVPPQGFCTIPAPSSAETEKTTASS